MIEQMDSVMLAIQACLGARRLYGHDHAAAQRHLEQACEKLRDVLSKQLTVRLVRIHDSLLFDDLPLPSSARMKDGITRLLTDHGIEWIEFENGVNREQLTRLVTQLERGVSSYSPIGTQRVKVGRLAGSTTAVPSILLPDSLQTPQNHVVELKEIWTHLHQENKVDHRLSDLVESVRRAVPAAAAVWRQMALIKDHDEYTFVHTVNVGILSAALAEAVGMNANQVCDITFAALLHDVGKQHTPPQILSKPGKLTDEERKQMERHTVDGAIILLERPNVPDFAPIVAFEHHANLDGTGYPNLGRGRRPHLASQIVHIADIFDALRTNRPYRAAISVEKVKQILSNGAGTSFDGVLLDVFLDGVVQISESQHPPQPEPRSKAA
jgi:putative nucleotidyltransferase with HDIG domain